MSNEAFDQTFRPVVISHPHGKTWVWTTKAPHELTLNWYDEADNFNKKTFPWTKEGKEEWLQAQAIAVAIAEKKLAGLPAKEFEETIDPNILDSDLVARTAMMFGQGYSRIEAANTLGVPAVQVDAWDKFWARMAKERRERKRTAKERGLREEMG